MKKLLPLLAVAVLVSGAARADSHTNKTFLMPRAQGVNLPMEHTSFEEEFIPRKLENGKFGATFAVTPFFQQSNDHDDTADYFLIHHKHKITLRTDENAITAGSAHYSSVNNDLDLNYLYHDSGYAYAFPYRVDVSLDPEQTVYGARMDYYQNLGVILKNLYLKIDAPIVHVENDPKLWVGNAHITGGDNPTTTELTHDIHEYLECEYEQNAESLLTGIDVPDVTYLINLQEKLTHAKIAKRSAAGVADVDVALGYKFFNTEKYLLGLALGVTVPAGNKATGRYMFEPIVGNGHHWGLGGDLYGTIRAWGKIKHNLKFFLRMKYRYLFEGDENRTLGIKAGPSGATGTYDWGQYYLLGKADSSQNWVNYRALTPAANVTTLRVDVTPGSQFDGVLGMTYNNGGFSFDLGYNLYYRDAEEVSLDQHLPKDTYFVAARNFDTAGGATPIVAVDVDGGADEEIAWFVNDANLDRGSAETPSQFTNSIYTAMSYTFKKWEVPMLMAIGGKYEFASENSALEQWSIWYKTGVTF